MKSFSYDWRYEARWCGRWFREFILVFEERKTSKNLNTWVEWWAVNNAFKICSNQLVSRQVMENIHRSNLKLVKHSDGNVNRNRRSALRSFPQTTNVFEFSSWLCCCSKIRRARKRARKRAWWSHATKNKSRKKKKNRRERRNKRKSVWLSRARTSTHKAPCEMTTTNCVCVVLIYR